MKQQKEEFAPIVLFAYNRPRHTEQTVNSLAKNLLAEQSKLIVYVDNVKEGSNQKAIDLNLEVKSYLRSIIGFKEVQIIEREQNFGLAKSIINGIGEVLDEYSKVIVMEDDLITSRYFLQYMNEALEKYEVNPIVKCVTGYMEPIEIASDEAVFLHKGSSWGWGTWKRVWDSMEWNTDILINAFEKRPDLIRILNYSNYPYYEMLKKQQVGKIDSWAIRFYANCVLQQGLQLNPNKTLVANIGFDEFGTHCTNHEFYGKDVVIDHPIKLPDKIIVNQEVPRLIHELRIRTTKQKQDKSSIISGIASKIKWLFST